MTDKNILRITNLDEQVKKEQEKKQETKKVNQKARKNRWEKNLDPQKKENRESAARIRRRRNYHSKMTQPNQEDYLAALQLTMQRHAEEDEKERDKITHGLLKQQDEMLLERAFQRQKQVEDRQVYHSLLKVSGSTAPAPEPQFSSIDTPMRPAEFMPTTPSDRKKKATHAKPRFDPTFAGVREDVADNAEDVRPLEIPDIPKVRLFVAAFDGDGGMMEASLSLQVQSLAQVADCTVVLADGSVRPIAFAKKHDPTLVQRANPFSTAKPRFELCLLDEHGPLVANEPITQIFSRVTPKGAWLVGKGLGKYHIWKYEENTGSFSPPASFCLYADGGHALVDDAVVGFDEEELSNKQVHAVLRKMVFSLTGNKENGGESFTVAESATKEETMFLPKLRRQVDKIVGCGTRRFLLASKIAGSKWTGHLFMEHVGELVKMPGFSEATIVDVAANDTHVFVRDKEGKVFFVEGLVTLQALQNYKKKNPWKEFQTMEKKSIPCDSISAFAGGCLGIKGTTAYFLFPTDNGCQVIAKDLDDIKTLSCMDGSGPYASFLGEAKEDDTNSTDGTVENDGKEDAKKPVAA